ncbi:MAG TPA: VTT domain-containing protein [Mycobacteriales bacterium]
METTEHIRALGDTVHGQRTLAFNPLDARSYLSTFGLVGVWAVLFAETGLFIGFFLPGDSLLFLAGVAASRAGVSLGFPLPLGWILLGAPVAAVAGAQLGHHLGARYGRKLFERPDSRLFKQEYVDKAEEYFVKYGPAKAVVLARFIPIVRTFLNPVAGVLGMPARTFLLWNVVGGTLWTVGLILVGYVLGDRLSASFPIDKYILPAVAVIVLLSLLPIGIEVLRARREKRRQLVD